jgi:hypothetical protein
MAADGYEGKLLFPIRTAPERYFYAGHLPHGRQALVARSVYGEMVAAIFDSGGDLLEVIRRELPSPPVVVEADTIREVDEDDFRRYLHQELGFSPGLIHIKEFCVQPEGLAVYHLPQSYQEFLRDPTASIFDDNDREAYPSLIERWLDQGQFVLEWGNDFWLDSTGKVVAS